MTLLATFTSGEMQFVEIPVQLLALAFKCHNMHFRHNVQAVLFGDKVCYILCIETYNVC